MKMKNETQLDLPLVFPDPVKELRMRLEPWLAELKQSGSLTIEEAVEFAFAITVPEIRNRNRTDAIRHAFGDAQINAAMADDEDAARHLFCPRK